MTKNFTLRNLFLLILFLSVSFTSRTYAAIVINEIYAAGGNASAAYNSDYVELYNNGATSVNISGYSLQYAAPGTTAGSFGTCLLPTTGDTTIEPGTYYLIQLGSNNTSVGSPLPTPDTVPTCSPASLSSTTGGGISNSGGKLLLVSDGTAIAISTTPGTVGCPATTATIVDFVGYGTANCSETAPAPAPANTQSSIKRTPTGTDTNNNSVDFTSGVPTPQASGSTAAGATAGGRVTLPNGRGIFRAVITMTDSQGNQRTAFTNQQGYFNFTDVPGGENYIFTASHRRYQFAAPSQIQFIAEDNAGINFTATGGNDFFSPVLP